MSNAVGKLVSRNVVGALSLGVLAAFAGIYVIWGTTYLAIAIAIQTVPPFISGAVRFLLAGALMYVWLVTRNRWAADGTTAGVFEGVDLRMAALCGVLLSGVGNGYIIWAQQGIPSGIAALTVTAMPILVLILDWAFFSKRTPTPQALLGTAIAIAGVATIVMHTRSLSGDARPMYLVALLVAIVGWSFGTLLQKRHARKETVLSFTCAQMLAGGLFQLLMALINREWLKLDVAAISTQSIFAVLYLVLFGSIVALNCYLWLLTRVPAHKVTTYALVNPVVALILGALVLNEEVTGMAITAAVLVLAGVALVLFQNFNPLRALQLRRDRAALCDASRVRQK
ncbi:MAG TPA: EamA family transporter [Steroidobacteraceae bacterium]|jgi:drug/metabolite transporter (DMT)-like permease